MFRLERIKFIGHPQLGDIDVPLLELSELNNASKPYTSVIIGPNGTGKSYILREIAEIFRQFEEYKATGTSVVRIAYSFILRYHVDGSSFEIATYRLIAVNKTNVTRNHRFFKDRPFNFDYFEDDIPFEKNKTPFDIDLKDLKLPSKVLAVSLIYNDRFTFKDSQPDEFYQYLGLRSGSGSTSTRAAQRKTIGNLFSASITNDSFVNNLKQLLNFLDFEETFKVQYTTRYNSLFFSNSLTVSNFIKFYERWWEEDFKFSARKENNPPWSKSYYDNNFKGKETEIRKIIDYLEGIINSDEKLKKKPNSSTKAFIVDFLNVNTSSEEIRSIQHLERLDILGLDGIKIKKAGNEFTTTEISSGESSLLLSIVNIFSRIDNNSLILIDEPEISLHPNWQMQYISFLKKAFSNLSNCHFVLTTHSHFLVSDLEGQSSSITALKRKGNKEKTIKARLLEGENTFGWSAEEVLYKVFNVRSTRNSYLEYDLVKLTAMINNGSNDYETLVAILKKLESVQLSEEDPLKIIIEKTQKYISEKDA
ncbi:AAA family ATPase [Olivibacter jilunii]|uniref:AAA family ATPase n=1 Tax=Olivibacter jilunii TaxID=985016 RepID=UPI0010317F54|nr:AAA family ATPase [Olivibacter jilunii]